MSSDDKEDSFEKDLPQYTNHIDNHPEKRNPKHDPFNEHSYAFKPDYNPGPSDQSGGGKYPWLVEMDRLVYGDDDQRIQRKPKKQLPLAELKRMRKNDDPGSVLIFESEKIDEEPRRKVSDVLHYVEEYYEYNITHNLHFFKDDIFNVGRAVDKMIEKIVKPHLDHCADNERLSVAIHHDGLDLGDMQVNYCRKQNFNSQEFLNTIYRLIQSEKTEFLKDGKLTLKVGRVLVNDFSGGRGVPKLIDQKFDKKSHSLIEITSYGDFCGYMAVFLGKCLADDPKFRSNQRNLFKSYTRTRNSLLDDTINFFKSINVPMDRMMDETKMQEISEVMNTYQIIVIQRNIMSSNADEPIFRSNSDGKVIVLEWVPPDDDENDGIGHFNLISSLAGYFGKENFCLACWKTNDHPSKHRCSGLCCKCGLSPPCDKNNDLIQCEVCFVKFHGQKCFEHHNQMKMCGRKIMSCDKCERDYIPSKIPHDCDKYVCRNCHQNDTQEHFCTIKRVDKEKLMRLEEDEQEWIVAFDIESTSKPGSYHDANLLVYQITCLKCWNYKSEKKSSVCPDCGIGGTFEGPNCVKQFVDFLCQDAAVRAKQQKKKTQISVYAHNFKRYDGRFIFNELLRYQDVKFLMNGSQLLQITVANIRFLDSLSFFGAPLKALPKIFELSVDTKKGWFPHLFNQPENIKYIGPIPPKSMYNPDNMSIKERNEFEQWHDSKTLQNYVFNFEKEIKSYCQNDVVILLASLMKYKQSLKSILGIDPTRRHCTTAALASEVFRSTCYPKDLTIAATPPGGYDYLKNASVKETAWLDAIQKRDNVKIARQWKIGKYTVDGFHKNTVYEFWGCHFHGCPECFPDDRSKKRKSANGYVMETHENKYRRTQEKRNFLKKKFNLVEIWEHDFNKLEEPYLKNRIQQLKLLKNLGTGQMKASLKGGRTNNIAFMKLCKDDEEIKYFDICSMYPYLLKRHNYPLGEPELITEDFNMTPEGQYDISKYFGQITCDIQPPEQLYLPLLPIKMGKSVYPLCRTCASEKINKTCTHTKEERSLFGTWTVAEVQKAVELGYVIEKIYIIFNFNDKSDKIFTEYINIFLKMKVEASGLPKGISEDDVQKFIKEYAEKEGIFLDRNNIKFNEGLRAIAKWFLNSLWGKFGQNQNMTKTETVTTRKRLLELITDPKYKILSEKLISDDVLLMSYEIQDPDIVNPGNTSYALSSMVTAYGRLMLHELLTKVEKQRPGSLLYFDTDSLMYVHKKGDVPIITGDFLGDLTDEIGKNFPGGRCIKAFFTGPKSYRLCVKMEDGKVENVTKVKGLKLNSGTKSSLPTDVWQTAVQRYPEPYVVGVPQQNFVTNKYTQRIRTIISMKKWQVTSDKRAVFGNRTLPYGWVGDENVYFES